MNHPGGPFRILRKDSLTPVTRRFVLEAPYVARAAQPGQFLILRVHEKGERIPISLADFDARAGTVTVVVQAVGRTSRLLCDLEEGGAVLDLAGPLGEPYRLPTSGPVIGVGGGFGAGALLPLLRALASRGLPVEAVVGARSRELLIMEQELSRLCTQVWPCTDDGSYGFRGKVTERLAARLAEGPRPAEVVAIGPLPMMRAVEAVTAPAGIPTQVSLDPIMVDGTGMCGGCRVTVGGQVKFACVDGPFFDAHQVDYEELARRGKMYKRAEAEALAS